MSWLCPLHCGVITIVTSNCTQDYHSVLYVQLASHTVCALENSKKQFCHFTNLQYVRMWQYVCVWFCGSWYMYCTSACTLLLHCHVHSHLRNKPVYLDDVPLELGTLYIRDAIVTGETMPAYFCPTYLMDCPWFDPDGTLYAIWIKLYKHIFILL